jgi:uncharacterized protein (TIRG00374 family)
MHLFSLKRFGRITDIFYMRKNNMKIFTKYLKVIISLLIGIILVLIWLRLVDIGNIIEHVTQVNTTLLIPAIFFYLLSYFFRSLRLRQLVLTIATSASELINRKEPLTVFKNYTYVLEGNFINYLIPIRAGDVIKGFLYKKNHHIRLGNSLPAIFVDKIFDTFAIFVVVILLPFAHVNMTWEIKFWVGLLLLVFFVGVLVITVTTLSERFMVRVMQKFFSFLPLKYKEKMDVFINLFVAGITLCRKKKRVYPPCIILTFISTLSDGLFFYLMFMAFGVEITFVQVLFGYTIIFLSYILPHPPGQIGFPEILMVLIFTYGMGFDRDLASAVMVLSHLITGLIIFITGTLSIIYTGMKMPNFDLKSLSEHKE